MGKKNTPTKSAARVKKVASKSAVRMLSTKDHRNVAKTRAGVHSSRRATDEHVNKVLQDALGSVLIQADLLVANGKRKTRTQKDIRKAIELAGYKINAL